MSDIIYWNTESLAKALDLKEWEQIEFTKEEIEWAKKHCSSSFPGEKNPFFGKKHSEESRVKMKQPRSEEAKKNIGKASSMRFSNQEFKDKMILNLIKGGKKNKGKYFWNNGSINKRSYTCPGEGWIRGRI